MTFFDIGTNSVGGTFAFPGVIGFTFMTPLGVWSGDGFTDVANTLTMQFQTRTATSGAGIVAGLETAVRDPITHPANSAQWGRHHTHFDFFIDDDPADGIYLMEFTLWYEAGLGNPTTYEDSESFWILFNLNGTEADVAIAKDWMQENLVPGPGALAILLMAGLGRTMRRRSH